MIPDLACHPVAAAMEVVLVALLLIGSGWDIARRRLPNWLTLAVAIAFVPWAIATGMGVQGFLFAGAAAVICFGLGFAMFQMNLMGGGDVKLIAAIALWMGLSFDLLRFVLYMGVAGGFLALLFLVLRLVAKRNFGELPYGVAITLAALIVWFSSAHCFVW